MNSGKKFPSSYRKIFFLATSLHPFILEIRKIDQITENNCYHIYFLSLIFSHIYLFCHYFSPYASCEIKILYLAHKIFFLQILDCKQTMIQEILLQNQARAYIISTIYIMFITYVTSRTYIMCRTYVSSRTYIKSRTYVTFRTYISSGPTLHPVPMLHPEPTSRYQFYIF